MRWMSRTRGPLVVRGPQFEQHCPRLLHGQYVSVSSVSAGKFGHFCDQVGRNHNAWGFFIAALQHVGPSAGTPSIAYFLSSFSLIGGAKRRLHHGHFLTLPCLVIIRQSSYVRKANHKHRLLWLQLFLAVLCPSIEMPGNCFNSEYDIPSPYLWQFIIDLWAKHSKLYYS
jgi:hypothetical protein